MSTRFADCHPDRKHKGNGLCKPCAQRAWRTANPGRSWYERRPDEARAYHKAWYEANRDQISERRKTRRSDGRFKARDRRIWLAYKYGITPEQYRDNLIGQAGRCAVCLRVPEKDLVVDHDHASGDFRGLLCTPCNHGLGLFRDDPRVARSAAAYLERSA